MFKDKLKAEIDNLKPTEQVKSAILNKLETPQKNKQFNFKLVSAIAVCLAIVIAMGYISLNPVPDYDLQNPIGAKTTANGINTTDKKGNQSTNQNSTKKGNVTTYSEKDGSNTVSNKYQSSNKISNYDKVFDIIKNLQKKQEVTIKRTVNSYGFIDKEAPDSKNEINKNSNYSTTNKQHEDVDEEDIVKTDGKYIYRLNTESDTVVIYKADGKNTKKISSINLSSYLDDYYYENEDGEDYSDSYAIGMYYYKDRLVVIYNTYTKIKALDCKCDICENMNFDDFTQIFILDISNPKKGKYITNFKQSGYYDTSRMIDDKLYISSTSHIYAFDKVKKKETTRYLPVLCQGETQKLQEEQNIYIADDLSETSYSMICSYDITNNKRIDDKSFFGNSNLSYVSNKNLYFTEEIYNDNYETVKTKITRFSIKDGRIEKKTTGRISGTLLNQFSLDEKDGYLRLVSTQDKYNENSKNSLIILDMNMKQVSAITNLAKGERIYSARFMGDYAYFVTFKETDPLFTADLSNPKKPKIIGKLKIPGFSDYLHPFGKNKLFGFGQSANDDGETTGLKLSMFDITDKSDVTEKAVEILEGNYYSEATYDHKAIFVSPDKNLIGFSADKETYIKSEDEWYYPTSYYLYSYDKNKGFVQECVVNTKQSDNVRGLYIGNYFYITTEDSIFIVNLKNFELVKSF